MMIKQALVSLQSRVDLRSTNERYGPEPIYYVPTPAKRKNTRTTMKIQRPRRQEQRQRSLLLLVVLTTACCCAMPAAPKSLFLVHGYSLVPSPSTSNHRHHTNARKRTNSNNNNDKHVVPLAPSRRRKTKASRAGMIFSGDEDWEEEDPALLASNRSTTKRNRIADRPIAIRVCETEEDFTDDATTPPYHEIIVNPGETILAALERSSAGGRGRFLAQLPPSDCRRGNCLTCAARVVLEPQQLGRTNNNAKVDVVGTTTTESDTGLAPNAAHYLAQRSLVLTCSTYVYEDGLILQLGRADEAWRAVYVDRLYEGEPELDRAVRARAIRKVAEQNVQNWIVETKKTLLSSTINDDDDDGDTTGNDENEK